MTAHGLDCQSCGACCVTTLWSVMVAADDPTPRYLTRLVRPTAGYARFQGEDGIRTMREVDGHCEALHGAVGGGAEVGCTCYGRRPAVCREFQAGSDDCLTARLTVLGGGRSPSVGALGLPNPAEPHPERPPPERPTRNSEADATEARG
jgi:hypothetical protein